MAPSWLGSGQEVAHGFFLLPIKVRPLFIPANCTSSVLLFLVINNDKDTMLLLTSEEVYTFTGRHSIRENTHAENSDFSDIRPLYHGRVVHAHRKTNPSPVQVGPGHKKDYDYEQGLCEQSAHLCLIVSFYCAQS